MNVTPEWTFLTLANPSRRRALRAGLGTLSATAIALLAGRPALAAQAGGRGEADAVSDLRILNTALGAEYEAVAAYEVGAGSGLLAPAEKKLALQFQGHHKAHADVLAGTVTKLGGEPVKAKAKYDFPTQGLKTGADVLRFAAGLERGAVTAYVGAVPQFQNPDLARAAATILGDEAMHWAVLRHAVGEDPVPAAFVG